MSLLCRLKNLVHKGVLKEKDLERIVIIPKGQKPCEDCISRAEALKNLTLTNSKDDVYRMVNSLSSVQPKTDVLNKIRAEIAELQLIGYATISGKREIASRAVLQIIDKYKAEKEQE